MKPATRQPIPRSALEPLCGARAAVIRRRRERAGWSLNELAARTNLSHPMIRFIETTERIPTIDTVARISRALGVPVSKLISEAEKNFDPRKDAKAQGNQSFFESALRCCGGRY